MAPSSLNSIAMVTCDAAISFRVRVVASTCTRNANYFLVDKEHNYDTPGGTLATCAILWEIIDMTSSSKLSKKAPWLVRAGDFL